MNGENFDNSSEQWPQLNGLNLLLHLGGSHLYKSCFTPTRQAFSIPAVADPLYSPSPAHVDTATSP